jgi:hypothetical protein
MRRSLGFSRRRSFGFGRTRSLGYSNLWNNDKPPSIEDCVYIVPKRKEIGGVIDAAKPNGGKTISPHIVLNIPICLVLWYEMGRFKRARKLGNTITMFNMHGDYSSPGIWDMVMREFPFLKAGYNRISV